MFCRRERSLKFRVVERFIKGYIASGGYMGFGMKDFVFWISVWVLVVLFLVFVV